MGLQDLIREDEAREDLEMSSVSLSFVAISVALKGIFVETLLFWLLGHDLQNLGAPLEINLGQRCVEREEVEPGEAIKRRMMNFP